LVIWLLLALVAAAIEVGLHRALLLSPAMASTDQALSGGLLIAAGLYQWSALKRVCLAKCQSPIGFLLSHWRDGPRGAFRMGGAHGLYCLGCCWLLMALLFVAGVMNLIWIAALSGVVLLEKILPLGPWPARLSGLAMIGGGAYLLLAKAFG
jgi:predicted metal-binding membrane protein